MNAVAAIDDEFDVELDADQLIDMTSSERAVRVLRARGMDAQAAGPERRTG